MMFVGFFLLGLRPLVLSHDFFLPHFYYLILFAYDSRKMQLFRDDLVPILICNTTSMQYRAFYICLDANVVCLVSQLSRFKFSFFDGDCKVGLSNLFFCVCSSSVSGAVIVLSHKVDDKWG